MQISDEGLAALIAEEGEVLRAYKDVKGVWTIGVGLTKASGVIVPKAGMTITKGESRSLLRHALSQSYEPEVEKALAIIEGASVIRPRQWQFDAGVSFHFNTGAIQRAAWVKLWKASVARDQILIAFKLWNRSGSKVLPALEARREREAAMFLDAVYRTAGPAPSRTDHAQWGLQLSDAEKSSVIRGLQQLGYVQPLAIDVSQDEARAFQRDHGLTADGILGRASLSTLQRLLDAKDRFAAPATAVAATTAATLSGAADLVSALPHHLDVAALVSAGIWLASHLWSYRTEIFGWLKPAPNPGA